MTSLGSQAPPAGIAAGFSMAGRQLTAGQPGAPWRFVARTSQFRWSRMATRLHAFAFVMPLRGDEVARCRAPSTTPTCTVS